MTQEQTKCCDQTQQQLHEKAAEHHEQAAKLHKEAVKYYESGDNKTAALHSYIAHGHTEQAREQERMILKSNRDRNRNRDYRHKLVAVR